MAELGILRDAKNQHQKIMNEPQEKLHKARYKLYIYNIYIIYIYTVKYIQTIYKMFYNTKESVSRIE